MEDNSSAAVKYKSRVRATVKLGSESFSIRSSTGILSQQMATMKEESMNIFKDFITKHNVPNDVPDEPIEGSSDNETEEPDNAPKKPKKRKEHYLK